MEEGTRTYLSVPFGTGQPHLPQHLGPLLHHQRPLICVRRDVTVVLGEEVCVFVCECV